MVTHSSLGRSPARSVCICLCVCERKTRKGSVTGHQMVTVWAAPRQGGKTATVFLIPLSFSLPLPHTHTVRVMADNGADTNKSAPPG